MNILMDVYAVLTDPNTEAQLVILKEGRKEGQSDSFLPIWVGAAEANAIRLAMEKITIPRPLTHDLLRELLTHLNVQLEKTVIHDVQRNTYYASLYLTPVLNGTPPITFLGDGMESLKTEMAEAFPREKKAAASLQIDARPSDAIVLSLRCGTPIYVEKEVLDQQDDNSKLSEWLAQIRPKDTEPSS
jgi:bifunctional DNase/RNase